MLPTDPLFIIGSPRSGTSLLRSMLNIHPQICIAPECGFLLWLWPGWETRVWGDADKEQFCAAVGSSRKFETWGLSTAALTNEMLRAEVSCYGDAAKVVYRAFAALRGKQVRLLGDKNNYYIGHVRDIRRIYPGARFIHIVRDVRDIVCSYQELERQTIQSDYRPRLPSRPAEIAARWRDENEEAMRAMAGAARAFVRYEDIIRNPSGTVNGLFRSLGVPEIPLLTPTSHLANLDEPAEFMQWKGRLAGPLSADSVGRYRRDLDAAHADEAETVAGPLLQAYGYLDKGAAIAVGPGTFSVEPGARARLQSPS